MSAAKKGQRRACRPRLSLHLTAMARSRLGLQQARLGQVPVSPGHRWLRGQGAWVQREGEKWQLPQPSLHPTAWPEGRMALVLVCQGAHRPGSHTHPVAQHFFTGSSFPAKGLECPVGKCVCVCVCVCVCARARSVMSDSCDPTD